MKVLPHSPLPTAAKTRLARLLKEMKEGTAAKSPHAKESYDSIEFDSLIHSCVSSLLLSPFLPHEPFVMCHSYDKLSWRMVSRAGGATVKPDDFYRLYALHMQATAGDNVAERPMWAEKGGLDFEGRARHDAWTAVKGLDAEKAKLRFVKLFYEFSGRCSSGRRWEGHEGSVPYL